jgi:outer membrane receptor protein involved in Fe transport
MHRNAYCFTLIFLATGAQAQTVEITATRERARQQDTAAMTVIGREDLLRYGDASVADALKRVAGISVGGVQGRGGDIRMRGLGNGYTQLLLNGQRVPAGFAIDSISPELIERVEILRVASAELGTQAIGGTINLVLRKSAPRAGGELKLGLAASNGESTPDLVGQVSGKGAAWSTTIDGVLVGGRMLTRYVGDELGLDGAGEATLRRRTERREREIRPSINLTPRIDWTLANGDTLTSQNFLRKMTLDLRTRANDTTSVGAPTQFPDNDSVFRAHAETVRSDLLWVHQPEDGGRWDVKFGANGFQRGGANRFEGAGTDTGLVRQVESSANEDGVTFGGKYSLTVRGNHTLAAGWDWAHGRRTETRLERTQPGDTVMSAGDETYAAQLDRMALFAQDDWTVSPRLSVSAGLRAEALRTRTEGNVLGAVNQQTRVLSPLVQALYKLSGAQQLRAGISRTFKMPTLANLAMRRYTADNNNSALNPDTQGNPHLVPEKAWGLDLAWERYFGKTAMVSAATFARRIEDVTIDRVAQAGTTWISTPVNAGAAATWGVELEAKFPLQALIAAAPAFEMRATLARNWSRVAGIPGPDNRLAGQVPLVAGVGVDHRLAALPVTFGASFNFQRGGPARLSERTTAWSGVQRELGMFAQWRVDGRSGWRLSVANLLGQDHLSRSGFGDQYGSLQALTATPTSATLRLAFEHKFEH